MKDWLKPENRYHSLALAGAVTFILLLTFLHGCVSRTCEMVLVPCGQDQCVDYRC